MACSPASEHEHRTTRTSISSNGRERYAQGHLRNGRPRREFGADSDQMRIGGLPVMFRLRHPWPPRPWQWTLGHLMTAVALCAASLGLSRLSVSMLVLLSVMAGLILAPVLLARKGYKL